MPSCRTTLKILFAGSILLFTQSAIFAQTNSEAMAAMQFNFSIPGAHSLALGGAFLALADDATAAYTNPAGLASLAAPEVSIDVRNWRYKHVFTGGNVTRDGVVTIDDLPEGEAEDIVAGLSFFSYVYPREHWAVAFYRHELANFEANFESPGTLVDGIRLLPPTTIAYDLDIVNAGVSAAYRLSPDLSLGIGLSYYEFTLDSITNRTEDDGTLSFQIQEGFDSDWSIAAGFLWAINDTWSVGGVYRRGPKFEFGSINGRYGIYPDPTFPDAPPRDVIDHTVVAEYPVPDVFGLGIAVKPTDAIRIAFDYDRVEYPDLVRHMVDVFGLDVTSAELDQFRIDVAHEFHLGFEYFFLERRIPFAVRVGAWYDPDHEPRFDGEFPLFRAAFRGGDDEMHYTAGFGIAGKKLQVDVGFDYSERVSTASVSVAVRF